MPQNRAIWASVKNRVMQEQPHLMRLLVLHAVFKVQDIAVIELFQRLKMRRDAWKVIRMAQCRHKRLAHLLSF